MSAMKRWIAGLCLSLACLTSVPVSAQGSGGSKDEGSPLEVRNSVSVILLSGLIGGILGLSTLSFYDKPQDNIRNITFGAGGGLIVAVIFLTASAATMPPPVDMKSTHLRVPELPNPWVAPSVDSEGRVVVAAGLKF